MANREQPKLKYYEGQYGVNWKRIREQNNMTVREFSKVVNMSYSSISKIENEIARPTMEQLYLYADRFNVSIDYLTGRTAVLNSDMRYICEYTGLSEKVVNTIVSEKQPHIAWIETLNALLENRDFILLITLISEKLSIDEEEISVSHSGLHTHTTNIDIIDYNISNSIKRITDDIKSTIPKDKTQSGKVHEWMKKTFNFNEKGM